MCYSTRKYTASFSPEILQALAVKGLNTTTLACFFVSFRMQIHTKKEKEKRKKKKAVKQRTVDGGVSIATGLAFADLTEVSLDEVRALLLFLRPHLGLLLHLAGNKPTNQVTDGHQLLRLEQIARGVLQNGNEVHNSCACGY